MPSASLPTPAAPRPAPPTPTITFDPRLFQPLVGPTYPKAGAVGLLVIAVAYFSLGVAVGAVMKRSPRGRRWLPVVVVPGLLAALAFVAWVIRSLL